MRKKSCWKVKYTREQAERRAAVTEDLRGPYIAYQCGNHWHIGHEPLFSTRKKWWPKA